MLLSLTKFAGVVPRISDPSILPDDRSQVAVDCRFDKGGITPLFTDNPVYTPANLGTLLTLFKYYDQLGNGWFLAWNSDVDVIKAPLPGDIYNRVFYTEGGRLKVTDRILFNKSGNAYPTDSLNPSPPAPAAAMVATGTPSGSDPTLLQTLGWVYTYVNTYGEEGPPSPVSNLLSMYDGNTTTLTNINTSTGTASLLLHLDGNLIDSGGLSNTPARSSIVGYVTLAEWNWAVSLGTSTYQPGMPASVTPSSIQYASGTNFDFSGGVWTVDFWLNMGSDISGTLFCQSTNANNYLSLSVLSVGYPIISGIQISLTIVASGVATLSLITSNLGRLSGVYHHVAVVENASSYYIFFDGNLVASAINANRPADYSTVGMCIGAFTTNGSTYSNGILAFIDEFRAVKGTASWTAAFTPPTQPYGSPSSFSSIYSLDHVNIYRLNQTLSSAQWQFDQTVSLSTTSTTDAIADAALGEIMVSTEWDGLPTGVAGLISLANGVCAAFQGNVLLLTPPGEPHAWPVSYQQPSDYPVVGLGAIGTTVIMLTSGERQYGVVVNDPANTVMEDIPGALACVSKRSIVEVEALGAVVYASAEGIISIDQNGAKLATAEIMSREDWSTLYNPSSISAWYWEGKYIGFYTSGNLQAGFMLDILTKDLVNLDFYATAGFHDPADGRLYLIVGGEVVSFSDTLSFRSYDWLSKRFRYAKSSLKIVKVIGSRYPVTVDVIFRDIPVTKQINVTSKDPVRFDKGQLTEDCEVRISGTGQVSSLYLASAIEELPL